MTGRSFRPSLADIVASLLLLIVGAAFIAAARALPPALYEPVGPAVFPAVAGMAVVLLSLAVLVRALLRGPAPHDDEGDEGDEDDIPEERKRNGLALLTGLYTIAYIAAMNAGWISFRWATVVFVLAVILTLSRWRPLTLVLAVLMALGCGLGHAYPCPHSFYIELPS